MRMSRVTWPCMVYVHVWPCMVCPIWKKKSNTIFFGNTTFRTLMAQILVLPRGQLGYLNSHLMLRWDGHFKFLYQSLCFVTNRTSFFREAPAQLGANRQGVRITPAPWNVKGCEMACAPVRLTRLFSNKLDLRYDTTIALVTLLGTLSLNVGGSAHCTHSKANDSSGHH